MGPCPLLGCSAALPLACVLRLGSGEGFRCPCPFFAACLPRQRRLVRRGRAYSVTFKDGRTLWLFGDTFVSDDRGRKDRIDMDLVLGTTLATSTCDAQGRFFIRYHLKRRGEAFVSSFGDGGDWLWPQDPVSGGRNSLYPPDCRAGQSPLPGPFKFEIAGLTLARIDDPSDPDPFAGP